MLLLDEMSLGGRLSQFVLFSLFSLFLLILFLTLVLKLDGCVSTLIVFNELNLVGELFLQLSIVGVHYAFKSPFLFGVVGVGFQQSLMNLN